MIESEMDKIRKLVDSVDGWLTDAEGELLYNLAKNCTGEGVIVEIGSWKGKSTIWLGKGSLKGEKVKVYAIDPHTGSSEHKKAYGKVWTFEEFSHNIKNAQLDDVVIPIVKTSEKAAKNFDDPVEFIFIDGAHEYELVKLDFELWFPKLINGGTMAFHDTMAPGPKKVVEESLYKSKNFRTVRFTDSITYAEKIDENSLIDRLKNRYVHLLMGLIFLLDKLHFPRIIRLIAIKIVNVIQ